MDLSVSEKFSSSSSVRQQFKIDRVPQAAWFGLFVALFFVLQYHFNRQKTFKRENGQKSGKDFWIWCRETFVLPFSIVYYLYKFRKDGVKFLDDFIDKHGPVSKIAKKVYLITDTTVIRKILSSTNPLYLNKTKLSEVAFRIGGIKDGLIGADPVVWAPHRKLLAPTFSFKSLQSYLKKICEIANEMGRTLISRENEICGGEDANHHENGRIINEITDFYTLKVISSVVMGADMVSDELNRKFRDDFQTAKEFCMFRAYRPWLHGNLWHWHPDSKKLEKSRDNVHQFVRSLIRRYQDDALIEVQRSDSSSKINDEALGVKWHRSIIEEMLTSGLKEDEIITEVLTFLIAGHESTTTQIIILLFHLALNKKEQEKCIEEIDVVLCSQEDKIYSMDQLGNLKHLERCILESLRLTPVFPIIMRRVDAPLVIEGIVEIEKDSDILIPICSLHRDEDVFENPLKFNSDRFLPERCKEMDNFTFLPFSSGPRNCIGWKLAMMEMKVIVANILKHFEVETGDTFEDIKFLFDGSLKPERDIDLRLKRRKMLC